MLSTLILEVLAFLSLAIWLALFFLWGGFWRIWESVADNDRLPHPGPGS